MGLLPKRGNRVEGEVRSPARTCSAVRRGDARPAGPDLAMIFQDPLQLAQPGRPDRPPGGRGARAAQGHVAQGAMAGGPEMLDKVGIPDPNRRLEGLPAPDVRRHAPARPHRHGPGVRAAPAHRRRADDRPRRDDPGADPDTPQEPRRGDRHRPDHDHARPRRRRRALRRGQRPLRRAHRRARRAAPALRAPAPPLHARPARIHPQARGRSRRAAQPDPRLGGRQPAVDERLRLHPAVPQRHRDVPSADARSWWRTTAVPCAASTPWR